MHLGPFFIVENEKTSTKQENKCTKLQLYRLKEILLHATPEQTKLVQRLLADIYLDRCKISLRTAEWGIFNFAKHQQSVVVQNKNTPKLNIINVYETYLSWRRNYKRKIFDQYRRETLIHFKDPVTKSIVPTTPAQINFFWFLVSEQLTEFLIYNNEHIKQHSKLIRGKRRRQVIQTKQQTQKKQKKMEKRELLIQNNHFKPIFIVKTNIQIQF